jgi:hypothetical protein
MKKVYLLSSLATMVVACGGNEPAPVAPAVSSAEVPAMSAMPAVKETAAPVVVAPTAAPAAVATVEAPKVPALPAPGTNMVAQRPFTPKSAFFVKRDHFGEKKDVFVVLSIDGGTCELAKSAALDSDTLKKNGSHARFAFEGSWKNGTTKIAGAESVKGQSFGGLAIFSFPAQAQLRDKNGSYGLYGSLTVNNIKGDAGELVVDVGDKTDTAKSAEYYLKTTLPVTRCK